MVCFSLINYKIFHLWSVIKKIHDDIIAKFIINHTFFSNFCTYIQEWLTKDNVEKLSENKDEKCESVSKDTN